MNNEPIYAKGAKHTPLTFSQQATNYVALGTLSEAAYYDYLAQRFDSMVCAAYATQLRKQSARVIGGVN